MLLIHAIVLPSFSGRDDFRGARELAHIALDIAIKLVLATLAIALAIAHPILGNASRVLASVFVIGALAVVVANVAAFLLVFS